VPPPARSAASRAPPPAAAPPARSEACEGAGDARALSSCFTCKRHAEAYGG
jgi:hypothetical protein